VIYSALRSPLLRLLRAPTGAPDAPAGSHDSVRIHRASPRFLTYRLVGFWLVAAFIALMLMIGGVVTVVEQELGPLLLVVGIALVAAFVFALSYIALRVDYDLRYYVITDRSLRVREGAWRVTEKTISYANVQNLHVQQGPLQRAFNISNLRVETAGGGASSAKGEGMTNNHLVQVAGIENAAEMRDRILEHLRRFGHGSGLGDDDDERRDALAAPGVLDALREVRASAAALRAAAEPA
jgi:membrane protein YdbS with pleckstrin-like domain